MKGASEHMKDPIFAFEDFGYYCLDHMFKTQPGYFKSCFWKISFTKHQTIFSNNNSFIFLTEIWGRNSRDGENERSGCEICSSRGELMTPSI